MQGIFKSFVVTASCIAVPVFALSDERSEYRWYFDSLERWCLQHDEKDLCLPKRMQATEVGPGSASFELPRSDNLPEISVMSASSGEHPFNEESFAGLSFELIGSSEINGIEKTEVRVGQLVFLKLQLTLSMHIVVSGTDVDRINRWASNLTAQWRVKMRTYSREGPCARIFMPGCVKESPVAIQLIEEIDKL